MGWKFAIWLVPGNGLWINRMEELSGSKGKGGGCEGSAV